MSDSTLEAGCKFVSDTIVVWFWLVVIFSSVPWYVNLLNGTTG